MGIKSFVAARKNQNKEVQEVSVRVSDYMSRDLITFKPEQTVEDVIDKLITNKISGGPVVNDNYELIGIISEGDCLKQVSDSRYYNMPMEQHKVETRMIRDVETIDGNMNIFDAANKFLESKRRRFPIVMDGKLVGQISQKDILKAALTLKGHNWK
ncbi:CBS domain-containing protein [Formosa sp. PL04]|uniref:CBS domain-containing protein n=1 Tax=Formosa sp. PL04 TaxID=3081755 RepID=UPI0029816B70|nr:CBS domain-containing protein [Formosa sp. PL04]MDW5291000.1 CBS domain-containing protein [Formosa sp. PL04]